MKRHKIFESEQFLYPDYLLTVARSLLSKKNRFEKMRPKNLKSYCAHHPLQFKA